MRRQYPKRAVDSYAAKVAQSVQCILAHIAANPVRPVTGIVALPPREPDAVERSPEHIRRAREVLGSVAGLVGHGGNMPSACAAVAPNNIILFGGSQS